jgi:CRP-like cAMP-binding protein
MSADLAECFPELARDLGPENLAILRKACTKLDMPAGRKIIRDRMPVDALYLILEGSVGITVEESGRSISLGQLGAGEWLGEVSVLSGEFLASSTVTALTDVTLLRLKHQAFDDIILHNEKIASALLTQLVGMLADRLRSAGQTANQPVTITSSAASDEAPVAAPMPAGGQGGRNWLQSFFGKGT